MLVEVLCQGFSNRDMKSFCEYKASSGKKYLRCQEESINASGENVFLVGSYLVNSRVMHLHLLNCEVS